MQDLDYAEMLEIPVSTVNVTKKKSFFRRPKAEERTKDDELKDMVVDSVNERAGAYVAAEDLSDPPKIKNKTAAAKNDGRRRIIAEMAAVCLIALAIFLTNLFMPNSAINTFIASLSHPTKEVAEPTYTEFELSPVVGSFSDAEITLSQNGVISFTAAGGVYPVCEGKVAAITQSGELYTVEIAHTSTFKSVISGLSDVYSAEGTQVLPNVPFAYSDGSAEVKVSMYDNGELLNCYSLSGVVPVWNS